MVAIKAPEVDGFIRRRDPRIAVFLVYGPDTGLVAERARLIAEAGVKDPSDPFQLVRMEGDLVASEPGRLAEEAGTIGLFGGRRSIWIRPTSKNLAPAVSVVLSEPPSDSTVVIEAGDLTKSSPLKTLVERSPHAAALPCYLDDAGALGNLVDARLKEAGLSISREDRALLLESLGGDRLASRGELEKLILYHHGGKEITSESIELLLSDVSALALDRLVDSVFSGDVATADTALQRLLSEGTTASTVLGALLRHTVTIYGYVGEMADGKPIEAFERAIHFRRKAALFRALRTWSTRDLAGVIQRIDQAVLQCRSEAALGPSVTSRLVLQLALQSRRARS